MENLTLKSSQYYTNRRHSDPSYNAKVIAYQKEYRNRNRIKLINYARDYRISMGLPEPAPNTISIVKINKVIHLKI